MANNYVSQFTGDELDLAISSALGDKYRGNLTPGCHTIGSSMDMQVDFNTLTIPGKYTAYFYINGPTTLIGVSPVCIQVFWGATMLYQTIQVGARLFWRDLISGDTLWKEINLGTEATAIVDNLDTDLSVNDKAALMALSANMGAELRKRMENLQIGNTNLMDFSNVFDDYFHTVSDRWAHSSTATIEDKPLNEFIRNSFHQRFPMVDDVDRDDVTVFSTVGKGSFNFSTDESNRNPVQMANKSMYTASVYVLCQDSYFDSTADDAQFVFSKDNSPVIYLKIISGDDVAAVIEKSLYQLFEEADIQYTFVDGDESKGEEDAVIKTSNPSIGKTNGFVRLTVTYTSTTSTDTLGIQFGMDGAPAGTVAQFVYPKIEYGQYATQYNHSWQDLYYFFNNCEEIFGVPININIPESATSMRDCITEQSGLIFNSTTEEFDVEPVAVGGGGGFVVSTPEQADTNPRKDKILIFDEGQGEPGDINYRIRGLKAFIDNKWSTLVNSPLTVSSAVDGKPATLVHSDCGWLDNTNETNSVPAVLNYWDNDRAKWRPVGAIATEIWFMQQEVPTDETKFNLIWIKKDTRAPYIYDRETKKWIPLLALWGSPNT